MSTRYRKPKIDSAPRQRFEALCAEVARRQDCLPSDEVAQHIATLRLLRENLTARLIAGAVVNPDHLLRLDETVKPYLPPAKPTQVNVKIVDPESLDVVCPACRHTFDPYSDEATKVREPAAPPPPVKPSAVKPSAVEICATSHVAQYGYERHRAAAAAVSVEIPLPVVADPAAPLMHQQPPSAEGCSINAATVTVPDGQGGTATLRPPLKRLQGDDMRRVDPNVDHIPPDKRNPLPVLP